MPKSLFPARTLGFGCTMLALASTTGRASAAAATQPAPPATQATVPDALTHRSGVPDIRPATRPTTRPGKRISLNFKDAPLDAVLDHLSEAAGLVIIREGPVEGRVTVQSSESVSPEESVTLLNAVLKANGLAAIQDGRIVRISARAKAKKENVPVHIGANPSDIAATYDLITQVIPVKNVDAMRLRQDLQPLIGPDADVTANQASNSIVITDSSANIRRIVEVINSMDQTQNSSTELRVLHLKFAEAAATAKMVMSVFRSEGGGGGMNPQQIQQMQQQGMQVQAGGGAREGRIPGGAIDQALHGGHVHAEADERTNSLILTAPAETLKVIEEIVKELDSNPIPVSQLKAFRLTYADAQATSKLISDLFKGERNDFPFFNPFGGSSEKSAKVKVNITFDERTNAVIVSAPAEVLQSVADLIKDLDSSPGAGPELRTYQLKYADAYFTAKMISSIFDPDPKDQSNNGFRFIMFGTSPPSKGAKVTATSDDRTNTLIVTGPKEAMKSIEDLVKKLDANTTAEEALFIYRLRNAQAANLEQVLNTLFGNTNSQNQQNNGQGVGPNGQPIQQNQQGQQGFGARSGNNGNNNQAGGTGIGARHGQRNGQGNAQAPGQRPRLSNNLSKSASEMAGEVFIVADIDTNSLIVTTASKYREAVREIIQELDRPAPQVLIKVLVAEVTHDNSADWGMDFSVLNRRPSGNGQTVGTSLGNAAAAATSGGLVVSLLETNLNVTLHALATEGKLDVLSRPYILASDNQLATITVGQEVPFITNTQTTDTGQIINTIQYQDVGIILNVTPHINPEGLVILDVAPEISQLTGMTVPITAGVGAPIIAKRSAESRVAIRNGQTIVIGGLMQDQKTSTVTKVPIIGDIPYLGEIFRRTQTEKTKTELLIFLTPHVALQPDTLNGISQEEMRGTRLTPGAVSPGTFEEHMHGMHRGATSETQPANGAATQPVRSIRGDDVVN